MAPNGPLCLTWFPPAQSFDYSQLCVTINNFPLMSRIEAGEVLVLLLVNIDSIQTNISNVLVDF